ncbi:MAG: diguanylate cyclase, partial [Armatimonadetes bacterium]|nr:diguanylate cyclase [Armatimonadota bacterium]
SVRKTISLGVATYPADADTQAGLIAAADAAMYRAKHNGKNQAVPA